MTAGKEGGQVRLSASDKVYRGDIDESGKIDIFDLIALLRIFSNSQQVTERESELADVNASGTVDIFDLLFLLSVITGRQQPEIIEFSPPPEITAIVPEKVIPGDTIALTVEGFEDEVDISEITAFIDSREVAVEELAGNVIKLVVPEWCEQGSLFVVFGSDTTSTVQFAVAEIDTSGIASRYLRDEGIENDPEVLFFEGFESIFWEDNWQERSAGHMKYGFREYESENVLTGRLCMRLDFLPEAGKDAAGWMHHWWDGSEVAYVRYYFKLSSGGNWGNQKIMQLHGHMRGERYGTGAGNRPTGYDWFSTGTGVGGDNGPPWRRVILYTYHPDQIGDYGDNVVPNQGLQPKIPEQEWVCYEFMIKLNDIGQANGEQRLWINGYLYIEQTGLEWRKHESMVINDLMQPTYTHMPPQPGQSRSLWLDSIVLAKSYIGPIQRNN